MITEPRIAAIMVIYNEKIANAKSYQSLLKSLPPKDVLIYDNSPSAQDCPDGFHYVHNKLNPGVSTAYNYGAYWAEENHYTHLLLLDSDSIFPEEAMQKYSNAATHHPEHLILAEVIASGKVISPFWFKWGKSWYGDDIPNGKLSFDNKAAINSAMLIPISQFKKSGGYNEKIPLDWSDIAFCRKLSRLKIAAQKIPLRVIHDLSESGMSSIESAKFRFKTYMIGVKRMPTKHILENFLILFWAKLKAFKLCLRYKSLWFLLHYLRKLFYA